MSRSGYDDGGDNWAMIQWRGRVTSAMRGRRGQAFLREMLAALDALCAEVRALGQRIDELRTDLRSRAGEQAEIDRRLRAVELRLASDDAARVSADRAHYRWRMAATALLSGISGVLGAVTSRWLDFHP